MQILLLHGALATRNQLHTLDPLLASHYVHRLSFTGHGGNPIPQEGLSFDHFVNDIHSFLDANDLNDVLCFGYSMGGYAALLAALSDQRIKKVITLGTKFDWTPETAAHETLLLNTEKMAEKIPQFVELLQKEHHPTDWKQLVNSTAELMIRLGENPPLTQSQLSGLSIPVHIFVGENDRTAGVQPSREFVSVIPNHQFEILTGTPHEWPKVSPESILHAF